MTALQARELDSLVAALPEGAVITDPDRMDRYRWDRAEDPDAGMPCAVVRATSTADVQAVVRFAAATSTPVVVRGAGTGLSGGSTAVGGGIVLSVDLMNDISIDPVTRLSPLDRGRSTRR